MTRLNEENMNIKIDQELQLISREIASIIKQVRKEKKMTQVALANLTGLPQKTISRIEGGSATPKIKTLLTIAQVLDIDIKINFITNEDSEVK